MASISQCDHCRKAIPARGRHRPGWVQTLSHGMNAGEPHPFGVDCLGAEECPELDFCSWACVAEYATARALVESPAQLPGMGGQ